MSAQKMDTLNNYCKVVCLSCLYVHNKHKTFAGIIVNSITLDEILSRTKYHKYVQVHAKTTTTTTTHDSRLNGRYMC